jgi:hypothetical protein
LFTNSSHGQHLLDPSSSLLQWRGVPASYSFRLCLLKVPMEFSSLSLPPSLVHSEHPTPSAACPYQVLIYYSVFFFAGLGQSVQGAMLVYLRGGCGSRVCCLFAHLLVCISQAGLEPASDGMGALLVSQCNVVWRSFVQAGGLGCRGFGSSWWFFSAKGGSSISARFLIFRAHTICFFPLATILDPLHFCYVDLPILEHGRSFHLL